MHVGVLEAGQEQPTGEVDLDGSLARPDVRTRPASTSSSATTARTRPSATTTAVPGRCTGTVEHRAVPEHQDPTVHHRLLCH